MTAISRALTSTLVAVFLTGIPSSAIAEDCGSNAVQCPPSSSAQRGDETIVTKAMRFPGLEANSELGKATQRQSGCADCEWRLAEYCLENGPADQGNCLDPSTSCAAPDATRFLIYLRHGTGPWVVQGSVCLTPGQKPVTTADVGAAVRRVVTTYLPDARPSFQPAAGGIVNLPTIFAAGEPQTLKTAPFSVLGFTVVVSAQARWEWTFDQGVVEGFAGPGGAYPDMSVAHTYAGPGPRAVSLTTFWEGTFTIDGEGPFPVPGPDLTKTVGPVQVPVREAHAELVAEPSS